jgi:hypothetical protein
MHPGLSGAMEIKVRVPNFIVIGAMKCGTSTLHTQLSMQFRIGMSCVKEPSYFSNDEVYARGHDWYASLFGNADEGALVGESSTNYTKLPTYPTTAKRIKAAVPNARLIYMMRDPIERIVSHYIHEWTMGTFGSSIDDTITQHPEVIDYGRYAYQLAPYLELFGFESVLPVFLERFATYPQEEMRRIGRFLDVGEQLAWIPEHGHENPSMERAKESGWRGMFLRSRGARGLVRRLAPKSLRQRIRRSWTIGKKPMISEHVRIMAAETFDQDLVTLGEWMVTKLCCDNFREQVTKTSLEWVQ